MNHVDGLQEQPQHPAPNRGPVWLAVQRGDHEAARAQLEEWPTDALFTYRRDAVKLAELLADAIEARSG